MRIGAVATRAGVTSKTIRFYEQAGLLPAPPRDASGYRDYPPRTVARIGFIRQAQSAGLTLTEIRGVLAIRDTGQPPCRHVSDLIDQHLAQVEARLAELTQTRRTLHQLQQRAAGTVPAECPDTSICTILGRPDTAGQ
jgi:MerR family transcriptional regulator, copper efflux regulator